MTFTVNEIAAMKVCLNYDTRAMQLEDNFSNGGVGDLANALGWNMHQIGGLIASLEKKGVVWIDDRQGDWPNCLTKYHIVWLTEKGVNAIFDIIEKETA